MIYVGSPYSDPDHLVRADRAFHVARFAAQYVRRGHVIYSPIASWHHVAEQFTLLKDFQFWKQLNFGILRLASEMWVLELDGWAKSVGLNGEMDMALDLYIPIVHCDGKTFERRKGYEPGKAIECGL